MMDIGIATERPWLKQYDPGVPHTLGGHLIGDDEVADARIDALELAAAPRVEPEIGVVAEQAQEIVGGVGPDAGQRHQLLAHRLVVATGLAPRFGIELAARH